MPKPPKVVKRFLAWSYSRYSDYLKCPLYAKLKHLDKIKEPEGPALEHGSAVHKSAEQYLKGIVKTLPAVLKPLANIYKELRKLGPAGVEAQWAFRQDWKECDWFAKDCWLRVVIDVFTFTSPTELLIDDHKTGRIYEEKQDQLEEYALAGFLKFPQVTKIRTRFLYIDQQDIREQVFTRDQLPAMQKSWAKKVKPMMLDTAFLPKPNDKCRFCHHRKSNGGVCKY